MLPKGLGVGVATLRPQEGHSRSPTRRAMEAVAADPFRAGEEEVGPCPVRTRNCRTTPDGCCLVEAPKTQSSLVWSSTPRCSFLPLLVVAVGAELVEAEAVGLADSVWCWPRPHSCSPPLALSGSLQRRYLERFYPLTLNL